MKELLIATTNSAKKQMYKGFLKWQDIKLLFLDDFDDAPVSPEENEDTVEKNSLLKAKYYYNHFKIPCIADDAWFSIDALNWEPWIMARRWWGALADKVSDEAWIEFFLKKISSIKEEPFDASFPYSRCLYLWDKNYFFQNGERKAQFSHHQINKPKKWRPTTAFLIDEDKNHGLKQRWMSKFITFIKKYFLN